MVCFKKCTEIICHKASAEPIRQKALKQFAKRHWNICQKILKQSCQKILKQSAKKHRNNLSKSTEQICQRYWNNCQKARKQSVKLTDCFNFCCSQHLKINWKFWFIVFLLARSFMLFLRSIAHQCLWD